MLSDPRCRPCFVRTWENQLKQYPLSEDQSRDFGRYFDELMDRGEALISPEVQRRLHHFLREKTGISDPFLQEKRECNRQALSLYDEWRPRVLMADDPFGLALRLAIAGNIMDYGANPVFNVQDTIRKVLNAQFGIDHSELFRKAIRNADAILYLGDNAGEIVFDKLLIETMMHPGITYAVKGGPIINDVTLEDALEVGMDLAADLISSGYDIPSTLPEKSAPDFRELFDSADLIISKGQGNLEGLVHRRDPRIFFLLMVKCDVIADLTGVAKGDFIVYNKNHGKD